MEISLVLRTVFPFGDAPRRRGRAVMKKTPVASKYLNELVKVNDQLCYSVLLHEEFEETILKHAELSSNLYTSSIFPSNAFSERLYRRGKDLPGFAEQSRTTGLRMAVIVGYEHAAAYLDDVQRFRAATKSSPHDDFRADALEDQVFEKLKRWLPHDPPKKGYFTTVGYCRNMRNSFAHAYDNASKELTQFAANNGHELNKFWENGKTDLRGLDFKKAAKTELISDMAFAFMNLLRICLEEIDKKFAASLSLDDVLVPVVNEIVKRKPELRGRPTKVASKARIAIEMNYGEAFPISVLQQKIEAFGLD
jgi:hypothetical protein